MIEDSEVKRWIRSFGRFLSWVFGAFFLLLLAQWIWTIHASERPFKFDDYFGEDTWLATTCYIAWLGVCAAFLSTPIAAVLAVLKVGLSESGTARDGNSDSEPTERESGDPY